ncbi:hypothetical protein QFZ38_001366 [Pseudomonas cedrina]|nr:hypothetical protein [Pseudomonas cedrina]
MSEPLVIPCPHCNGLNRIPAERLGDAPKCGRCKQPVLLNKPFELKQGDYASQIKGDLPLLVDVWADWCGPCKSFAPVFEQAAGQIGGQVPVGQTGQRGQPAVVGAVGDSLDSQFDPVQEWPGGGTPERGVCAAAVDELVAWPRRVTRFPEQCWTMWERACSRRRCVIQHIGY